MAQDKEPRCLCRDEVLTNGGRRAYAQRYAAALLGQVICDASTDYAKRPDHDGIVDRALQVQPAGFKVIYMVRHPVERIASQHHHEFSAGLVSEHQDKEIRQHSRFVDYSSYAYQLQPWLEAVGSERIKVIRFEDYVARRQETVEEVCEFLGLAPGKCQVKVDVIYNNSAGKPVPNNFWRTVSKASLYKSVVRKLISPKLRLAIYRWVLPAAPEKPVGSHGTTLNWLHESLVDDVYRLSEMLGLDEPLWADFASVTSQTSSSVSTQPGTLHIDIGADAQPEPATR